MAQVSRLQQVETCAVFVREQEEISHTTAIIYRRFYKTVAFSLRFEYNRGGMLVFIGIAGIFPLRCHTVFPARQGLWPVCATDAFFSSVFFWSGRKTLLKGSPESPKDGRTKRQKKGES